MATNQKTLPPYRHYTVVDGAGDREDWVYIKVCQATDVVPRSSESIAISAARGNICSYVDLGGSV
jgi:hypothetical protein